MSGDPGVLRARSKLGGLARQGASPERLAEAARDLAEAKARARFEELIDALVAEAPPLTDAQRQRLAVLLASPRCAT